MHEVEHGVRMVRHCLVAPLIQQQQVDVGVVATLGQAGSRAQEVGVIVGKLLQGLVPVSVVGPEDEQKLQEADDVESPGQVFLLIPELGPGRRGDISEIRQVLHGVSCIEWSGLLTIEEEVLKGLGLEHHSPIGRLPLQCHLILAVAELELLSLGRGVYRSPVLRASRRLLIGLTGSFLVGEFFRGRVKGEHLIYLFVGLGWGDSQSAVQLVDQAPMFPVRLEALNEV